MTPGPEIDPPEFDEPEPEQATALEETINVAEPYEVRKQVRRRATQQRSSAEFWQSVFSTEEGRAEIWKILEAAGTFDQRSGVSPNGSFDPSLTAFHAGQKALGQHFFLQWLGYDKESVMQMLIENQPQAKDAAKTKRARKTPTSPLTVTNPP